MKRFLYLIAAILFLPNMQAQTETEFGMIDDKNIVVKTDSFISPKREFRGVWVHTVFNELYSTVDSERLKKHFCWQLDKFKELGINAILFQVRPEADAFYKSEIEPWSRYLTGVQGQAPDDPDFDPMAFLIEECHKRNMQFHAWLNPYRVNANKNNLLHADHMYYKKRYLFMSYGNQLYFNPGIAENREHICKVVKDIVSRYDIDGIHMDDYFYPYPIKGLRIQDQKTFKKYCLQDSTCQFKDIKEWRRNNVNILVEQLSKTIKQTKPWVLFGISPFGIYRNIAQDSTGSKTRGISNYDNLYADVKWWSYNNWIDYEIPQIYWEIGHELADYTTLVKWWADNKSPITQLYIGQDVSRSVNQIREKLDATRADSVIMGNCFWSGDNLLKNIGGICDSLKLVYHNRPALLPIYERIDKTKPDAPFELSMDLMGSEPLLKWRSSSSNALLDKIHGYAIYVFEKDEPIDISTSNNLYLITNDTHCVLPDSTDALCFKYVVTSLDRMQNESMPSEDYLFDEDYKD